MMRPMPKKKSPVDFRPRLVVMVAPDEFAAITREADSIGLKNANAWARMKLAAPIKEISGKR